MSLPDQRAAVACAIGPLVVDLDRRLVMKGAMPLPVGERAAAVLTLLIRRAGQLVTKDELMSFAWNDLAVEENNLTVQIASLRKLLRDGGGEPAWIETMPRRGYRFIGPVQPHQTAAGAAPRAMPEEAPRLAILPFRSRSPNHGDDLFATGIVEEIISLLASLREVTVLSFGTMATIDPQSTNLRDIGQSLGVRYTVTGAMWRSGNHLRLIVELTDCESGVVLWSAPTGLNRTCHSTRRKRSSRILSTRSPRGFVRLNCVGCASTGRRISAAIIWCCARVTYCTDWIATRSRKLVS